jgi:hypothetical protein
MLNERLARGLLRAAGLLLMALGALHLAATPFIPSLLNGMPAKAYRFALGPTLLNHVLVGFLLFPLGYSTWVASSERYLREKWARRVLRVNAAVLLTFPLSLVAFMRQPEYYHAPLFVTAAALVALISVLVAIAAL